MSEKRRVVAPVLRICNNYAFLKFANKDNIISDLTFGFIFGFILGAVPFLSKDPISIVTALIWGFGIGIASIFGAKVAVGLTISSANLDEPCPTISFAAHLATALGAGLAFGFIYGFFAGFNAGLAAGFVLCFSALVGNITLNVIVEKL